MNEPEFSTCMDGYWKDRRSTEHTPKTPQEVSPEQVSRLWYAFQEILRTPDGLYLYKHDPVFHSLVRRIEEVKKSRQAVPIEFLANTMKEICEGAFRSVQHAMQLVKSGEQIQ